MADLISMLAAAGGTEGEATDADFENTVLLLHGDGTNGAQNNTFLDSSTNNFTITRNGNTTQGTFTPFSKVDGRWGTYYDGTDDYLSVADNAVLRPGAGAFTLEAWIYRNASGAAHTIYAKGGASTGISFLVTSGNVLRFTHTTTNIDSSGTVAANAWVHVAVVREGTGTNQTKLYINGTQDGQGTVTTDFTQTEEVRIGTNRGATDDFAGYISNVRFVKGSALYTGNFTPSTSPFTTTSQGASSSEVELLTCQSNRFIDNSTNNFTITRNGDVRVTPFSPFPITTAYSTATNGGSGYFDGSGDYLTVADSATLEPSSSNFTIECWIYPTATGSFLGVFSKRPDNSTAYSPVQVLINGGQMALYASTTGSSWAVSANASTNPPLNAWSHIAVVRNGTASNNLVLYLNGVSVATGSVSNTALSDNAGAWAIGADSDDGGGNFAGYIAGFRSVIGSAVYTSAFTPPTAPPTAISNTVLLTNFTNAGIFDNTGFNNLETVGNAQIDTSVKKYGTGAMKFDGTGDYLVIPNQQAQFSFGTGDFTIEAWVYLNSMPSGNGYPASYWIVGGGPVNTNPGFDIAIGSTNLQIGLTTFASLNINVAHGMTINTWYHIAVVRSGSTLYAFKNGVQLATASVSGVSADPCLTGIAVSAAEPAGATSGNMNGYIDDLRITKGIARYTSAFTPPTAALPDIGT